MGLLYRSLDSSLQERIDNRGGLTPVAETYYVDRNTGASGDGKSLQEAFLTIGEGVAQLNADYAAGANDGKSSGRMRRLVIMEGWYGEVTMTLSAYDCHIVSVAPGHMGRSVLYGSLTAGGFDDGNTGPALALTGWNNTIDGLDFVNRSATISGVYAGGVVHTEHPCILEGVYATGVGYNRYVNLGFMRDQLDAASWGIISYSQDQTMIEGCTFNGASLKQGGIAFQSGATNHSADVVRGNYFYGCPTGIWQNSSHNTWIHHNFFSDQGAVAITSDKPCDIAGGTAYMFYNFAPDNTLAEFNAGASGIEKANICSDSDEASFPDTN